MSEYEPDDSRTVTHSQSRAPGEPPRTGPREGEAHARAGQGEQGKGEQGQAAQAAPEAGGDRAVEGDSAAHPDRMGAFAGEDAAGEEASETSSAAHSAGSDEQPDRWAEKADDQSTEQ